MGKNKKRKNDSGEIVDKIGQQPSAKKQKRDGKADKKDDHLEHIPFRLQEIIKSKERMEQSGSLKEIKLRNAIHFHRQPEKSNVSDIAVPHFKRGQRESESQYKRRMEMESKQVLFLTNNQVERKPELDEDKQENPPDQRKTEKKKEYNKQKSQKKQQKKLERREDQLEKEMFQDDIPFGEVSMEPPSLTSKPKKAPIKPQATKELLLNSLLGHAPAPTTKPSMARQRIMEEERQRAVLAYRQLKKQRQQQQEEARTVRRKVPQ
ncbi:coiled-coil domain-containing protein 137 [Hippocampus zosterae]|uniref:coiled-coil domain-containing protein 137 n=1 Tax=Hippocampus zosterae TaxID=109293 RepID=UPI00223DC715|nr:coiled-coil domain-containing protein 137 [Hippocampus zosterae]